jgi:hypothetical protein
LCVEIEPDWGTAPISRDADSSSEATVVKAPWRKRYSDEMMGKSSYTGTNRLFSSRRAGIWRVATSPAGTAVA